MGWVSPTGFVDPVGTWSEEPNAYDDNIDKNAVEDNPITPADAWGQFIELTHAAFICDKVRFIAYCPLDAITAVDVDVYWLGGWHHIYEGAVIQSSYAWREYELGGTYSVTAMRFRFYNDYGAPYSARLHDSDFNEVVVVVLRSYGLIIG